MFARMFFFHQQICDTYKSREYSGSLFDLSDLQDLTQSLFNYFIKSVFILGGVYVSVSAGLFSAQDGG